MRVSSSQAYGVALRKESVDRNYTVQIIIVIVYASLSARRAWIEITATIRARLQPAVALRKESVDRNLSPLDTGPRLNCRSPQGERG